MASPSFAPFAHPHVSYISYSHSEDVDNSTGVYYEASNHSEPCRHSEASDANLDVRMSAIETEMKDVKAELKCFKTDMKDFYKGIFHKIDVLGITFEKKLDSYAHEHEQQLSSYAHKHEQQLSSYALDYKEQLAIYSNNQQKELSSFYVRCFFGVSLILHIIYQFLTRLRLRVSRRC
jgi:hypothetical protein